MKKSSFVPTADRLESRVVLSHGPQFVNGAAVLTRHALNQTYGLVQKAFVQFAHHGQNYARLERNLASAVNRIPWNKRDGLLATIESEVPAMQTNIATSSSKPVVSAMNSAMADVQQFVKGEIANGTIVLR